MNFEKKRAKHSVNNNKECFDTKKLFKVFNYTNFPSLSFIFFYVFHSFKLKLVLLVLAEALSDERLNVFKITRQAQ